MPDKDGIPTPEELGTQSDAPPAAVEAEKPPKEPEPAKQPEPEVETEEEEEPAAEFATVEEMTDAFAKSFAAIEKDKAKAAAEATADADLSEDERAIKALTAENAQLKSDQVAAQVKEFETGMVHQVKSAAGKYKMSDPEVELVGEYFAQNPDLIGVWSFERGALHVLPELKGRLNAAPPAQPPKAPGSDAKAAGVIDAAAAGPVAPKPFQHDNRRRDYSDITKHVLSTPGELAKLGSY